MFRTLSLAAAALSAVLLAGCATPSLRGQISRPAPTATSLEPEIYWEIDHRFRLLAEEDEERFFTDLGAYTLEYDLWFRRRGNLGPVPILSTQTPTRAESRSGGTIVSTMTCGRTAIWSLNPARRIGSLTHVAR